VYPEFTVIANVTLPLSFAGVAEVSQPPDPPQAPPAAVGEVRIELPLVNAVLTVIPLDTEVGT
jgi:hypothetical protein